MEGIVKEDKKFELNRPITGIIHKDRIWEQWYDQKVFLKKLPKMNQTDYMFLCNEGYEDQIIINNRGMKNINAAEFNQMVNTLAQSLKAAGIGYKDIIATVSLSTPELVALKYACSKIGAITANLNFNDVASDKENSKIYKQLKTLNPSAVFVLDILENSVADILNDPEFKHTVKVIMPLSLSTPILNSERIKIALLNLSNKIKGKKIVDAIGYTQLLACSKYYNKDIESVYNEKMVSNIAFTSGTTGDSKAVLLSHDANNALAFQHENAGLGLERGHKNLALVPPFLAFWDADIIHMAMCLGVENILELALTYENIPKYLKNHLPNYGIWSQYLWDSMLTMNKEDRDLVASHLEKVVVGGERADVNQIKRFEKMTGLIQEAGYGATEVDSCFTVAHPNCNIYGSAGLPMPFNNVRVVKDGQDLTYNEPGRILITGPGLMNGYYNRPDLTNEVLEPDEEGTLWYNTGDYGFVDITGSLVVIDRDKPLVEINSKKINLADISELIKQYPDIKLCKTNSFGNYLVSHVSFDNYSELSETDLVLGLQEFIKKNIPSDMQPNIVNIMDTLPRTPVGKVDYPLLQEITEEIIQNNNFEQNAKVIINKYQKEQVRSRKI